MKTVIAMLLVIAAIAGCTPDGTGRHDRRGIGCGDRRRRQRQGRRCAGRCGDRRRGRRAHRPGFRRQRPLLLPRPLRPPLRRALPARLLIASGVRRDWLRTPEEGRGAAPARCGRGAPASRSIPDEDIVRLLAKRLAGPQDSTRKVRMVRRIGPDLRLQAQTGERLIQPPVEPRHCRLELVAAIELDARAPSCAPPCRSPTVRCRGARRCACRCARATGRNCGRRAPASRSPPAAPAAVRRNRKACPRQARSRRSGSGRRGSADRHRRR